MRKDFIATKNINIEEAEFVEKHWSQIWDSIGIQVQNFEGIQRKEEYQIMKPFLANLPHDAAVLDGGCGLGEWTLYLSNQGLSMTALDLSKSTIKILQNRYPKINFRVGDIRDTGFPGGSFDAYFSWGVFEHFEAGPQDSIKEALRLLKPGGFLFISVPLDNLRQSILGAFAKPIIGLTPERFYQYRFTRAELARELYANGFEVISLHPIHKRQGILRSLHHEFGLPYGWLLTRGLSLLLTPFVPKWWISHMLLAVATKPT